MRFTAAPVCLPPGECSSCSSKGVEGALQESSSCRYPISRHMSLACHPVHIAKHFQDGCYERVLCCYSPLTLTTTPAHTPDCSPWPLLLFRDTDICIVPLAWHLLKPPHDQGSSLAQLGSLSCHCFLLSCSAPQPLSCTLSTSSIS